MFSWGSSPPPPTTQQVMRAEQRRLGTSQRELEREINTLRRQEQDMLATIKREAKKPNNDVVVRARARDLVKIRGQIDKLQKAGLTLSSVKTQTAVAATSATIATAMSTASRAMSTAVGAVSVEELQRSAMEMQKQQQIMEVTDEMLEDMFADGIDEDEADDILAQVSEELQLDFGAKLAAPRADSLPSAAPAVRTQESDAAIDDMIARLLAS